LSKVDTVWPWSAVGESVNLPDASATVWDFSITDDGTSISMTMTAQGDPSNTATWSADTNFDQGVYHIAYSSTDMTLDNVQINVVPEPGTLALFTAGLLCLVLLRKRNR